MQEWRKESMRIVFKRVELHNFMSFSDEVFEFDKQSGLNLICGKNNDIPGSRNGVGKCLDPNTRINIEIDDPTVLTDLQSTI